MSIMMGNLYQALREGGTSDEGARKAAEEVAGYENRFAKVETDMSVLKWMVGFNLAVSCAILLKLLA
jgi:hypothetical protein